MDQFITIFVQHKKEEEYHKDCVDGRKHSSETCMMFWEVFHLGKIGLELFFRLELE